MCRAGAGDPGAGDDGEAGTDDMKQLRQNNEHTITKEDASDRNGEPGGVSPMALTLGCS